MQRPSAAPRWPSRLQELVQELHGTAEAAGAPTRGGRVSTLRGDIWLILHSTLTAYTRFHARRLGPLSDSDLADLVSEKSLDLLARIDTQQWDPIDEAEGRVRAFVSTVARNGVVDNLRANSRLTELPDTELTTVQPLHSSKGREHERHASDALEASEFVACLSTCVESLTPRARKLWFFRVLYEMPSLLIARHPDIQMNVGSVDVALQRCRQSINECMQTKGMRLRALPPGTFAALWEACAQQRNTLAEEEGLG